MTEKTVEHFNQLSFDYAIRHDITKTPSKEKWLFIRNSLGGQKIIEERFKTFKLGIIKYIRSKHERK